MAVGSHGNDGNKRVKPTGRVRQRRHSWGDQRISSRLALYTKNRLRIGKTMKEEGLNLKRSFFACMGARYEMWPSLLYQAQMCRATCKLWRNPEYPAKISAEPQITGNLLTSPGRASKPDSGERQRAVIGNTLDHSAIKAGPSVVRVSEQSLATP